MEVVTTMVTRITQDWTELQFAVGFERGNTYSVCVILLVTLAGQGDK